jgi:hypothetical protein
MMKLFVARVLQRSSIAVAPEASSTWDRRMTFGAERNAEEKETVACAPAAAVVPVVIETCPD